MAGVRRGYAVSA